MICVGSGVPGDIFEWGHEIIPGTEKHCFGVNRYDSVGIAIPTTRCRRCASTRYYWKENISFALKGGATIRKHAVDTVKRGFARDVSEARTQLRLAGVTGALAADVMLDAVGKPCPGLCCYVVIDDSAPLGRRIEPHIIQGRNDVEFDWRDPRYPLTPENSGPLCPTCNRQKHDLPWPVFILQQRSIRVNLEQARAMPSPNWLFDPRKFG